MFFERAKVTIALVEVKAHSAMADVKDYLERRAALGYPPPNGETDAWMAPIYEEVVRRLANGWRWTGAELANEVATLSFFRWKLPFGLR